MHNIDDKSPIGRLAKRLLGHKSILAHILAKTVDEFKRMNPKDVEALKETAIIFNMHKKGFTLEQIANATDKDIEEIAAIIECKEPVLA